jgi:hypothetical protein
MRRDLRQQYLHGFDARPGDHKLYDAEYRAFTSIPKYETVLLASLLPLRENFRKGKYCLIVGEDSSARLCTLVVGKLASEIASSAEVNAPKVKFIKGCRFNIPPAGSEWTQSTKTFLEQWTSGVQRPHILYCSESISTGLTLSNFLIVADEAHVKVDVIIAEEFGEQYKCQLKRLVGEEKLTRVLGYMAVGPYVDDIFKEPIVFKDSELTGIAGVSGLNQSRKIRPRPAGSKYSNNPAVSGIDPSINLSSVAHSRRVVALVAENLYQLIGPELSELFDTINLPFQSYKEMSEETILQYVEWLKLIKVRISRDSRVDRSDNSSESAKIECEYINDLISCITKDMNVQGAEKLYNESLEALKKYIKILEARPYPQI